MSVHKVSVLSSGCIERSNSRLTKAEIGAFTGGNTPLEEKHHKEVERYRRTLVSPSSSEETPSAKQKDLPLPIQTNVTESMIPCKSAQIKENEC
ncbi:MAG: hypothetical protein CSA95_03195 [Bacteroidetes bacterium]|nr:MAG: hypothetical protein CSA95_03195 [Bacteroidota bacterium]